MARTTGPGSDPPTPKTSKKKKGPSKKQPPSRKGKEIARDPIEDEESESDAPPLTRSKPLQKKTKKNPAKPRFVKTKPNSATLARLMNKMDFFQTKWFDENITTRLGICGDVKRIFDNMGLATLLNLKEHAYQSQTIEFLSTLEIYDDTSKELSDPERAYITFRVDSVDHSLTLHQIASVIGFAVGGDVSGLTINKREAANVWKTLSMGKYKIGASKSTSIRHPAIRYAHAILASTLFARKERGYVKEEELALLIEGIKPLLLTCSDGTEIIGQERRLNMSHFLINKFLDYKEWASNCADRSPQIHIGGLVTPILRSVGVELRDSNDQLEFLDAGYLTRARFLAGRVKTGFLYRFLAAPNDYRKIVLPHKNLTRTDIQENVPFRPRPIHFYNPVNNGPATAIPRYPTGQEPTDEGEPSEPQTEAEASPPSQIHGSERYHFQPYDEPIRDTALRKAHEKINTLQRWMKYNDKVVKALVKTVKKLKKKLKGRGSSSTRKGKEHVEEEEAADETIPDTDESETEAGEADVNRSATLTIREPGSSPTHERRPTRKRRATRSPSTSSSSGNPVPSMDTSTSSSARF